MAGPFRDRQEGLRRRPGTSPQAEVAEDEIFSALSGRPLVPSNICLLERYGRASEVRLQLEGTTSERRTPVTLFTVQLEIGPETRAMIERVAANAVMHLELGPKTREMIKALPQKDSNNKDEGESLLRKGVDAALRK